MGKKTSVNLIFLFFFIVDAARKERKFNGAKILYFLFLIPKRALKKKAFFNFFFVFLPNENCKFFGPIRPKKRQEEKFGLENVTKTNLAKNAKMRGKKSILWTNWR